MSKSGFVVTREMLDDEFCPPNCPHLYEYSGGEWTCEPCGHLYSGYFAKPIRGDKCVLQDIADAVHIELVESFVSALKESGFKRAVIPAESCKETAEALRVLLKKVQKG